MVKRKHGIGQKSESEIICHTLKKALWTKSTAKYYKSFNMIFL